MALLAAAWHVLLWFLPAWHNIVGTVGVLLILAAYLLVQTGRVSSESLRWSIMNGVGAALVLVSLSVDVNLPAIFIESAWVVISLYGVYRWYRRRASRQTSTSEDGSGI